MPFNSSLLPPLPILGKAQSNESMSESVKSGKRRFSLFKSKDKNASHEKQHSGPVYLNAMDAIRLKSENRKSTSESIAEKPRLGLFKKKIDIPVPVKHTPVLDITKPLVKSGLDSIPLKSAQITIPVSQFRIPFT